VTLKAPKPPPEAYPKELNTLGDHLRKKRLDLGLTQTEVARQLNVHATTVQYWETNRVAPDLRSIPRIIRFLTYVPYKPGQTFSERLRASRKARGVSQKELANILEVDPGTLARWEAGRSRPSKKHIQRLESHLNAASNRRQQAQRRWPSQDNGGQ
jgi:transcriptional regulator with XRE-family HTH domain